MNQAAHANAQNQAAHINAQILSGPNLQRMLHSLVASSRGLADTYLYIYIYIHNKYESDLRLYCGTMSYIFGHVFADAKKHGVGDPIVAGLNLKCSIDIGS